MYEKEFVESMTCILNAAAEKIANHILNGGVKERYLLDALNKRIGIKNCISAIDNLCAIYQDDEEFADSVIERRKNNIFGPKSKFVYWLSSMIKNLECNSSAQSSAISVVSGFLKHQNDGESLTEECESCGHDYVVRPLDYFSVCLEDGKINISY